MGRAVRDRRDAHDRRGVHPLGPVHVRTDWCPPKTTASASQEATTMMSNMPAIGTHMDKKSDWNDDHVVLARGKRSKNAQVYSPKVLRRDREGGGRAKACATEINYCCDVKVPITYCIAKRSGGSGTTKRSRRLLLLLLTSHHLSSLVPQTQPLHQCSGQLPQFELEHLLNVPSMNEDTHLILQAPSSQNSTNTSCCQRLLQCRLHNGHP